MTHTAGIDVSLETSCVCMVDASGRVVREMTVESEPEALATALVGTGLTFARVGLEAGPLSQWRHAGLTRAGLPALLIETRRLRAATKTMPVKTDRNDARAIAQVVRTGWFRAVHVKSVLSQEVRDGARKLLVGKVRDLDNAIRALLRGFGLKVGRSANGPLPNAPATWSRDVPHWKRFLPRCSRSAPHFSLSATIFTDWCWPRCATSRSAGA